MAGTVISSKSTLLSLLLVLVVRLERDVGLLVDLRVPIEIGVAGFAAAAEGEVAVLAAAVVATPPRISYIVGMPMIFSCWVIGIL